MYIPCFHYDCSNRNSFGYCKTTVCINKHYNREQWGVSSTTNKVESLVIKPQTNGDRIRAMTDEELAELLDVGCDLTRNGVCPNAELPLTSCRESWLDWLKQEAK